MRAHTTTKKAEILGNQCPVLDGCKRLVITADNEGRALMHSNGWGARVDFN